MFLHDDRRGVVQGITKKIVYKGCCKECGDAGSKRSREGVSKFEVSTITHQWGLFSTAVLRLVAYINDCKTI